MKLFYTLVIVLFSVFNVTYAQETAQPIPLSIIETQTDTKSQDRGPGDILYFSDFSDPTEWIIYGDDDTDLLWEIGTELPEDLMDYMTEEFTSPTVANGFAYVNGLEGLLDDETPVLPINTVLQYDSIMDLSGVDRATLSFYQAYRKYRNDTVFVELTGDDWENVFVYPLFADLGANEPTREELVRIFLDDVLETGTDLQMRFRWREMEADPIQGAGFGWIIDDLKVEEAWEYDLGLKEVYHRSGVGGYFESGLTYYSMNYNQRSEIHFSGVVENRGSEDLENVRLIVEVSGADNFTSMSAPVSILSGETDSLIIEDTFIPDDYGESTFTYWIVSEEVDQFTPNDTVSHSFWSTDYMVFHSRSNRVATDFIDNVAENEHLPFFVGNVMEVFSDDCLRSCKVRISSVSENEGQLIYAALFHYAEELDAFVYVDQSYDHEITGAEVGGVVTLFYDDDIQLNAGGVYLIGVGHYGGEYPVRFEVAQPAEENSVLYIASGEVEPDTLEDARVVMIDARVGMYSDCSINTQNHESNSNLFQNKPNPFGVTSVIPFQLDNTEEVSLELRDMCGKIVRIWSLGSLSEGEHTFEIAADGLASGMYAYTLITSSNQITKTLIINN